MMEMLLLWSLAPAFLVFLGGMLVRRAWPGPDGWPYFAFYLLSVAAVILTLHAVVSRMVDPTGTTQIGRAIITLLPAAAGALVLLFFHLRSLWGLHPALRLAALFLIVVAVISLISQINGLIENFIPPVIALALAMWLARSGSRFLIVPSLLVLAALIGWNSGLMEYLFAGLSGQESTPIIWLWMPVFMIMFFGVPALAVGLGAGHLYRAAQPISPSGDSPFDRSRAVHLALALLLIGYLAFTIFWISVWDHTSDGMGGIFFTNPASMTAVAAGLFFGFVIKGWRVFSGAGFAVLVPILLLFAFNRGWQVSYHELTENRAGRIESALERYYTAHGKYPTELSTLTPRYLLSVPKPLILENVGWCYRAGEDHYRLGTYYREFFGFPVSFRLYAQAGSPPDEWACEELLYYVEARYPAAPMFTTGGSSQFVAPTPEPLPSSRPSIGRQMLRPFFAAEQVMMGRWSADGRYLSFSVSEGDPPLNTHLYLYDAQSDEVCRTGEAYLRHWNLYRQNAWLPDGRMLYLDALGRPYLLEPCNESHVDLTGLFGGSADRQWSEDIPPTIPINMPMFVHDPISGRALLEVADRYWLLDAGRGEAVVLEGLTPNPFDGHWDHAVFSPSGEQMALSRMNARDGRDGSTLYILDTQTLDILKEIHLPYASNQSAPMIRWLNENELTIGSEGVYSILDLRTEPPGETRVIEDIFGLGLRSPHETSSSASVQLDDGSYRLGLRANHPRNQAIYIYSSASGLVQTYHYEEDVILIFDGGWFWLTHFENAVENRDNHIVIWPDQPGREHVLIEVEGHTPRSYAHLSLRLLPERGLAVFSSAQGVSLHDIHSGQPLAFYGLEGDPGSIEVYGSAAADEGALVVLADRGGLYRVPLP
jgi:hypothetical protein